MPRLIRALVATFVLLMTPVVVSAQTIFPNQGQVGLIPPPGMVEIPGVAGFEDREAKAAILILEMPAAAYADITRTFEPEALQSKGVIIDQRREIDLPGGRKGTLLTGFQTVGAVALRKWILLAADKDLSAMVTVQFPQNVSERYSDAVVEGTLKSVVFRPPPSQEELLARLPFRIGDLEGYRVLKVLGGSAVLLTKGEAGNPESEASRFFIVSAARGEVRQEERESLSKRAIASVPGVKELRVERGGPLRVGGQPGFELIAKALGQQSEQPVKVAQWLQFGRAGYVRMVGVSPEGDFTADFTAMRALRDSIELR